LFKNDLNKNNISLEDIHKDEFWKILINDKHIRCILNYIKSTDSIKEAKEIINNLEEECKCGCKALNELVIYLKQKNQEMNSINLHKSESEIDLDELIQQINKVEVKKSNKKKKKKRSKEDVEITEFKKNLLSDSKHSNNTFKLKPSFTDAWIESLK
jgi:chromosome segregation ATPase